MFWQLLHELTWGWLSKFEGRPTIFCSAERKWMPMDHSKSKKHEGMGYNWLSKLWLEEVQNCCIGETTRDFALLFTGWYHFITVYWTIK